ncbi:hypothetical protein KY320_00950 [Candidatus Woesearchaeota archaeon]|nr:hypothetical protein [Candidatus Woesearchaeota archaeon]
MKKRIWIGLIVAAIIVILFALNFIGALSYFNKFFSGAPDKSCITDSDCVLRDTSCGYCDCGDAVNKDWHVFCPFKRPKMRVMCEMCPAEGYNFDIKCVNNQCQRIWAIS